MGSRVCDIKKKFEGLCEASKETTKVGLTQKKSNSITNRLSPTDGNNQPKSISENENNNCSVGSRCVIKRSHAFRLDKTTRNDKQCHTLKESHLSFVNKILLTQDKTTNKNVNLTESPNNPSSLGNLALKEKTSCSNVPIVNNEVIGCQKFVFPLKNKNQSNKTFKTLRPDSLQFNLETNKNHQPKQNSNKDLSLTFENFVSADRAVCLSRFEENKKSNSSVVSLTSCKPYLTSDHCAEAQPRDAEDSNLSNTLKKVLKSPLPSGPPPKKPPRTFTHFTDSTNTDSNFNGQRVDLLCSDDIKVEMSEHISKPLMQPIRSKTESQIMLKKLEQVLINHRQKGRILEPRKQTTKDASADTGNRIGLSSPSNYSSEFTDHSNQMLVRKSSLPLPETPTDKNASASGCFGGINCSNSMDLLKSSHIYDIPFEPKSQFYVEDKEDISHSIDINKTVTHVINFDRKINHYGKVVQSDVHQPVYAKPQTKSQRLNNKPAINSSTPSVLEIVSHINGESLTGLRKSPEKFKAAVPVLHYMSSPILEKAPSLPSSAPPLPDNHWSAAPPRTPITNGRKTFPGRSASVDVGQSTNTKSSNRSFSVDFTQLADKDFHIYNEKIQRMVSEVYSQCLAMPQDSDSDSVVSTPDDATSKPLPTTSPEEVVLERKTYLRRVCSRAKSFHRPTLVSSSHLFDYVLLIGLDFRPAHSKVPYIKTQYPPRAEVPHGIEHLCFPDAADWPPQTGCEAEGDCYCIVITDSSGDRKYGYCRRVRPEGAVICLPLAYCVVSSYKANSYFGQILVELESRHGQPEQTLNNFIEQLYKNPLPTPGKGLFITDSATGETSELLVRKLDRRQEDTDLARLLGLVRFSVFLQLFATLLLERKVILLSYSLSKLSACIEGLCVAIYPFHWQHTLVPVVPSTMLDLCQAPTPYLIGLLKPREPHSQPSVCFSTIDQALVVDVDDCRVVQSCGDESGVLPQKLCRGLREALSCAVSAPPSAQNLIATEALTALFVQLVGHYRDHIITDHNSGQRHFQRESFVKSVSSNSVQSFLDWFSETTMFTGFIESRLDRSVDPCTLFEQRCVEHLSQSHSKSYRSINKTVKSFGDRLKEWTNSS